MTMGSTTMERSAPTSAGTEQLNIQLDALQFQNVKSIQLADGWHDVQSPQRVQFTLGEAHSPIVADRLYPALKYQNEFGKPVRTPLKNILSYSEESMGQGQNQRR